MEYAFNYVIIDSFGMEIWSGNAESIVDYISGWDAEEDQI